jgi:beta-N-acetylhexosaminidase
VSGDLVALAASVVVRGVREEEVDDLGYPFGGYVFFDRNAPSLRALRSLTDRLRARYDDLPPILAIDQEGGRVMRLREGIAPMPPAAAVGAAGDERLARATGARCAYDLRRAGCNVNLAPVLDLAIDEKNTVIGDRSFGSDPQIVTRIAGAFARGMEEEGVAATFKHFPGHGATPVDSHEALPEIAASEATLRGRDLVPFASLLPGARAVMTAHVLVPALDPAHPATLSPRILQGLLRRELGFRGVCFTDCLEMGAIATTTGSVTGALDALAAGADVLSVSHDAHLAVEIVERIAGGVRAGTLPRERLQEAATRVRALRASLAPPLPL